MSGIATGGFTVTRDAHRGYGTAVKIVTMVTLALGAFSFSAHYALWKGRWRWIARQTQLRTLAIVLVGGLALLMWIARVEREAGSALDLAFMWLTSLCTAGFTTVDETALDQATLLMLIVGMFLGGAAGSTTGGIKAHRAAWLFKGLWRRLVSVWLPGRQTLAVTWNGRRLGTGETNEQIFAAATLITLYALTLGVGTLALSLTQPSEVELQFVFFEAASALGNVGLSTGIADVGAPADTKLVLMALMWMGRLEIIAVLSLLTAPLALRYGEAEEEGTRT